MVLRRMLVPILFFGLVLAPAAVLAADEAEAEGLTLTDRVPKDPLLVYDIQVGNLAERLEALFAMITELEPSANPASLEEMMAAAEADLGVNPWDDFVAQIGPEIALVVDLPPVDRIMGASNDPGALVRTALGGTGLILAVEDEARVLATVRAILADSDAEVVVEDGMLTGRMTFDAAADPPAAAEVFLGTREGLAVLGFDAAWVRGALDGRPEGERLSDGEDFRKVFEHLDRQPTALTYVNVPKIRLRVEESEFLRGMIEANEEARPILALLQNDDLTGLGVGSTTVELGDGARTSTFGPRMWTGGSATAGIMAAIAVPNFLNAMDRGKQKRTMADMRTIATAMESFAIDNEAYPTTGGWSDPTVLAQALEPIYIKILPKVDGWDAPFLVWSDGTSYRIVSAGKDGAFEGDWSGEIEAGPTSNFADDIVFADGQFVRWPEGAQQ